MSSPQRYRTGFLPDLEGINFEMRWRSQTEAGRSKRTVEFIVSGNVISIYLNCPELSERLMMLAAGRLSVSVGSGDLGYRKRCVPAPRKQEDDGTVPLLRDITDYLLGPEQLHLVLFSRTKYC